MLTALQRATGTIVIVHAVKTAFALLALGQLGLELAHSAERGDLIAQAARAMQLTPRQVLLSSAAVLGYALLGPLLLQWLLASLGGGRRPSLGSYARALALSLARYVGLGVAAGGGLWLAGELTEVVAPQLEHAAGIAPFAGAIVLMGWLSTVHDVAQAELSRGPRPGLKRAIRSSARATTWRLIAIHAALSLAGLALFALGEALARALPGPLWSVIVTQACALGTSFAGAAWLARALALTSQPEQANPFELAKL